MSGNPQVHPCLSPLACLCNQDEGSTWVEDGVGDGENKINHSERHKAHSFGQDGGCELGADGGETCTVSLNGGGTCVIV